MSPPTRGIGATVEGVTRTFAGPVPALRGVDLTVEPGSFTAVLGPSGCGKSTLLRVVAGLERPDAGTVSLGGMPVAGPGLHVPAERRHVGLVPQEGALFPHLDVAGNVGFGLHRVDRSERRARVGELLELVGLEGYGRRRPHELSGGQQQRVALARALAPRPGIVLLDEPFSALDAGLRATVRTEVAATLRAAGATAVLVTHDQTEALSASDAVAVMRDGRITQCAAPAELYRRPVDEWTGSFVGAAVTLDGTVSDGGESVRCALGRVAVDWPAGARPDGSAVRVFLRPEQVVRSGAAGAGGHGIDGEIVSLAFEGSQMSVVLAVGGVVVDARWPSSGSLPAVGERVRLEVAGNAVGFPDPGGVTG